MKHVIKFNEFILEGLEDTSWTREYKGKETTIYLKDVIGYLDRTNVPVEKINTKSLEKLLIDAERDKKRVDNSDLSYPIILCKSGGKFIRILDGNHRLAKCVNNGINKIKARVLDLDKSLDEYKFMFGE